MAIKGMEFLEDLGRDIETDINKAVNDSILTVANKLVEKLRLAAPDNSGFLAQSISALPLRKEGSKWIIEIEWEEYGTYQDEGVKGAKSTYPESAGSRFSYTNKMPPTNVSTIGGQSLRQYAESKGISPFAVAKSIFNKGLKATGWATTTIESREVQDLVDDIATLIVNQYE